MQTTSLEAWGLIQKELGEKQFQALNELALGGASTNNELAERMGLPINRVTPRIHELRGMGLVRQATMRPCKITGFQAKVWEVVEYEHAQKQFRLYLEKQRQFKETGEIQREFLL